MKTFTVSGSIAPSIHYHLDFSDRIENLWQFTEAKKNLIITQDKKSGKTTLVQHLEIHINKSASYKAILLDFSSLTRNDFSTFEKFISSFRKLFLEKLSRISPQAANKFKDSDISNINELGESFNDVFKHTYQPISLIIDDADIYSKYDNFNSLLGLIVKKQKDMLKGLDMSFSNVFLTSTKRNPNFKPSERGLMQPDRFELWDSPSSYDGSFELSASDIQLMLMEYATDIEFNIEPETWELLLQVCQGSIYILNHICLYFDNKLKKFNSRKTITANDIQHAAGYILTKNPNGNGMILSPHVNLK